MTAQLLEVHLLEAKDIFLNLAMEQKLFLELPEGARRLLMWTNEAAVVMGRFQNPWVECNLPKMVKEGVVLARRQSGGGTVYHDRGNVNISFMDWNESYDKDNNNKILLKVLKKHGLDPLTSGRSDIQIRTSEGDKKVSGAAFKKKKDRSFHHCTMLLNSDLELLNQYLSSKIDPEKVTTKAIASVRSKVSNIDIERETFVADVIESFETFHGAKAKVVVWSEEKIKEALLDSEDYLKSLRSWKWVFGETPLFETHVQDSGWGVGVSAKKGVIKEVELTHEEVHPSFLELVQSKLAGVYLKPQDLRDALTGLEGAELYGDQLSGLIGLFERYFAPNFKNLES